MSHFLESPFVEADFERWQQAGSAVFTKNKIVLNPEVKESKGAIYNKQNVVLGKHHDWIVDLKVGLGNEDKTTKGGNGMGIYYLRTLNKEDIGQSLFGYTKKFDGLAIFLNTLLQKHTGAEDGSMSNYVQGFLNDGQSQVNFMKTTGEHNCVAAIRNRAEGESF